MNASVAGSGDSPGSSLYDVIFPLRDAVLAADALPPRPARCAAPAVIE